MCFPASQILNLRWEREGDISITNSSLVDFQLSVKGFLVGGEKVGRAFLLSSFLSFLLNYPKGHRSVRRAVLVSVNPSARCAGH